MTARVLAAIVATAGLVGCSGDTSESSRDAGTSRDASARDATSTERDAAAQDGATPSDASASDAASSDAGPGERPRGLFLRAVELVRGKARIEARMEPFHTNYTVQRGRAMSAMSATPSPFHTTDLLGLTFGWGREPEGADDTLGEAVSKFERDGDRIRTLALEFALTGDTAFATKAVDMMRAWAMEHTPVDFYELNIDFDDATFDGSTEGFDSPRPWNMALDAMWQGYGLLGVTDAYLLLTRNGHTLSPADDAMVRAWLRRVADAVNASFHAWTRWADAHPSSSSFERYRSDNHLSWALAPLLATAAALEDANLAAYVLDGGTYTDHRGLAYANPSHVRDVIDRAIEGAAGPDHGRVYEERILRNPPVGYSFFHLWALALVARIAEVHFGVDVYAIEGADGAGILDAFERYVDFMTGERASPMPAQEGDLVGQRWMYELVHASRPSTFTREALALGVRNSYIVQSIGPVTLLIGEDLP